MWAAFIRRLAVFITLLWLTFIGMVIVNASGVPDATRMVVAIFGGLGLIWGVAWVLGGFRQ